MARKMKNSGIEWIGEIPEDWNVLPAYRVFSEVKKKNSDGTEQNALQFKFGAIIRKANFDAENDDYVAGTIAAYTVVEPGTVMVNGLNLNYDFKTQRTALVKEKGVITSAYLALWPNQAMILPEFATYLIKGYEAKMALHNMGAGIRLTLGYKEFKKQPILLPPIQEQFQIVAHIEKQCSSIDSIIAQTRSSIEEYNKLKQAVITQAVTKGVRGDRPMKDSWIGEVGSIPDTWNTVRLKFLMDEIVDCPHETPEYSFDGEYYVIRTADQDYARLRSDANMYRLSEAEYSNRIRRLPLNKDDIVYGREGERWGLACLVPESDKYCLGQRIMQFRCNSELILPEFAVYALSASYVHRQGEFDTLGSTSPHVNIATIRNYYIFVPSLTEQEEVVNFLKGKCAAIDSLIEKKEAELLELESYKKSLIYEYVTGKKEVPIC